MTVDDDYDDYDDVGRRRAPDPLGKRALFWVPGPVSSGPGGAVPVAGAGRRALFSSGPVDSGADQARLDPAARRVAPANPAANRGSFVVECGSCRSVSRVGLLDLLIFQLPFGAWLPRGRFDRRMTCPACRQRVWASVMVRR
jgi:hypothetical protein